MKKEELKEGFYYCKFTYVYNLYLIRKILKIEGKIVTYQFISGYNNLNFSIQKSSIKNFAAWAERIIREEDLQEHKTEFLHLEDFCVVCGSKKKLTRHHILPKRYLKNIPQNERSRLDNLVRICRCCHRIYETIVSENEPIDVYDIENWREHFIEKMNPKYLSNNWNVKKLERKFSDISQNSPKNFRTLLFPYMIIFSVFLVAILGFQSGKLIGSNYIYREVAKRGFDEYNKADLKFHWKND